MSKKPQKKKRHTQGMPDDIDEHIRAIVAKAPPLSRDQVIAIHNALLPSSNEIAAKEAAEAGRPAPEPMEPLPDPQMHIGAALARQRAGFPEPTDQARPQHRTHLGGDQIVRVKEYSYLWAGNPLRVGDEVLLPGSEFRPEPWIATVTGLGSTYHGEMKHILRRLRSVEDTPLARVVHHLLTSATANADAHLLETLSHAASWRIGEVHTPCEDGDLVHLSFTLIVTDEHGNQTNTIDTEITVVRSDFYHALAKL